MNPIAPRSIQVAVSHPVPLIVAGVLHTLSAERGISARPRQACDDREVDIVMTDLDTALELASRHPMSPVGHQRPRIAVIAPASREAEVRTALAAGIQGYLLWMCRPDDVARCVHTLNAGGRYFSEEVLRCLADSLAHEQLTPREFTVLELLGRGLGNKAIAKHLSIGLGTVKSHVKAILDKLEVCNRTQAVTVAVARGLVPHSAHADHHRLQPAAAWTGSTAPSAAPMPALG